MHILLTDILTCPRCGPAFGLILLSDRMQGRRVLEGVLGCANCREKYPVHNGRVDFTGGAAEAAADARPAPTDTEDAVRLAALMGVTAGPAYVLLVGTAAAQADGVARLYDDVEVIAETQDAAGDAGAETVNRMRIGHMLPFANARLAAVALGGAAADSMLEEGARVTAPLGRLVLEPAPATADARLEAVGLRVLLRQEGTIIAGRH